MNNSRLIALRILIGVFNDGKSLSELLPKIKDDTEKSLIQALVYGVCRYYFQLEFFAKCLLEKPLKEKDFDIYLLILLGIYQLHFMRIPEHAAISETVNTCIALKKPWAKNLVNAILRGFQREQAALLEKAKTRPRAYYSHPEWLFKSIQAAWPNDWQAIMDANNQQAPIVLRINQQKIPRDAYLKKLDNAITHPIAAQGIILNEACDITALPGFHAGEFCVQDGAAQIAASLLQPQAGMRVLDACAAPGGKTTHLLETEPSIDLLAIDKVDTRINSIHENLARLQLNCSVKCADILNIGTWWDGKLFDRILLDAPCSATGVIRRHPDIKLLRREEDITELAQTQLNMLKALWPLLKPNGLLLYATCSILPEENTNVIKAFLSEEKTAQEILIDAQWGKKQNHGRQILPGEYSMDGFYYCLLSHI